jgi:ribonuclease D
VEATLVETEDGLASVVAAVHGQPAVAVDTEFHRERTYFPQVALVQLAWADQIVLVDPLAVGLEPLRPMLDSDTVIVMHAAAQDLEVMDRACGTVPARLFDTQLAAGFLGYGSPSLASLLERLLSVRLPKGDRLTDWLRRPLGANQRAYAASDVEYLLPLYDRLCSRLDELGRLAWSLDECDELRRRGAIRREPEEAWWRIKEARSLRGPAMGVAQAVAAWRERRAATIDQPARFVLPDLALVGIAQHPPTSAEGLRRVRGLDDRHLRGTAAEEILAAVHEGEALDRSQLRQPPAGDVDKELRPAVALVAAWVGQLGRELHIDTALLATRADLEALLRGDDNARLATGWRAEVLGDQIRRLVDGDAALAFDGNGGLVLEARSRRPAGS